FSVCLSYLDPRDRHSFPTRRSSDLTVDGWHTHNGARLLQWDYDSQNPRHQQLYQIASGDGSVTFKSVHSNKCLSVDWSGIAGTRSEEHTSELQSRENLVCRLLLEKK